MYNILYRYNECNNDVIRFMLVFVTILIFDINESVHTHNIGTRTTLIATL